MTLGLGSSGASTWQGSSASATVAASLLAFTAAHAFDLQGHRGARGLAPENTLAGFETALAIGVTTLELDLGMTRTASWW